MAILSGAINLLSSSDTEYRPGHDAATGHLRIRSGCRACTNRCCQQPCVMTPALRIVDSITELKPGADGGCLAISGSHGGMSAAHYALAARPLLSVFNDAGVGKEGAGIAALDFLQQHGLAACAVAHTSARIGEAGSTLQDGHISHCNSLARELGVWIGEPCSALVRRLSGQGGGV